MQDVWLTERRLTPLWACRAKLNALVMISTFCDAYSLSIGPTILEKRRLSAFHRLALVLIFRPSWYPSLINIAKLGKIRNFARRMDYFSS